MGPKSHLSSCKCQQRYIMAGEKTRGLGQAPHLACHLSRQGKFLERAAKRLLTGVQVANVHFDVLGGERSAWEELFTEEDGTGHMS